MTWILASERLPDSDIDVLIHCPDSSDPVWMAYYEEESGDWVYPNGARCEYDVLHWSEFPEPPC